MSKPKLALIPSGYKGSTNPTVYSILPNDASGDFDYERNGNATRVRKDGLIEELTVDDTPRLDWLNSDCPSLKLEPQRTNLITYSEDFSNGWSYFDSSIDANVLISPSGVLNASKFIEGNGASIKRVVNLSQSIISGNSYTFSIFAKKGERDFITLTNYTGTTDETTTFNLTDGTITSGVGSIESFSNDWFKCTRSFTATATITSNFIAQAFINNGSGIFYQGDGTSGLYLWGAQLEQGDYPTSYIKTEGGIETRFKDECLNGGDSDLFDITEGTFFVDAVNFGTPLNDYSMITLSDGSNIGNFVRFIYESSRIRTSVFNGTTQQDYIITGTSDNQRNKVAITFKENEFKTYLNGVLKDTDTSGVVPTGFDRVNFSNPDGTSRNFEGKVYDTRVYDRVLTEAEAIELTT